jgi:23S rRNA G2069 N7-methylase RlmK/C1962 C5-methylase RlmI
MKIRESYERLKPYLEKNNIEAYRLYRDNAVAVDIYKDNAVIHAFGEIPIGIEDEILKCVPVKEFFYKNRTGKGAGEPVEAEHKEDVVTEYGHKFLVNLSDYLDVGLFLDHRETRKWVASKSKDKIVLNTFAYTGSFSIYSAIAGAAKTYTVDLSRTYCDWVKKNLALNNLPEEKNWVYKMDTLEFFRYAKRKNLVFDIIIIDPPTFSKNKGDTFSVERDYPALINGALDVLSPTGFIVFSNNCKTFHFDQKRVQPCKVRQTSEFIPPDFDGVFSHHCFIVEKRA